ncbi:MAG: glycosyltransferase family 1 protein [Candidatus Absconditabacterales bacterium]
MHILYDHQVFSLEVMGGMTKYYTELIEGLLHHGHQVSLPIVLSNNIYLKTILHDIFSSRSFLNSIPFKGRQNLLYWYNKYYFLRHAEQYLRGIDLVHLTLYDPYLVTILERLHIPFVFNVYDLNHKTQQLKKGLLDIGMCDYADTGIAKLGAHAKAIICVSNQTKKDLLYYYPAIDPQKIQVIYHSIDVQNVKYICDNQNTPLIEGKYILFIGKRGAEYKNFLPLVESLQGVLSDKLKLVCLGHEGFTAHELAAFDALGISEFAWHMGGDEAVKYNLLKFAQCFVYPSLAEGFGIPILEAWAAGCPVLASNISVFMEIGAGACLYFDPQSKDNMKELIVGVAQSDDLQHNLRQAGLQRVKEFDKSVELEKTIALYSKIIS